MDLRHYLEIVRRQKWIIIEAVILVAVIAGVLSAMKTPVYQSTARIALNPNDPSEQVYSTLLYFDPDRFLALQTDIIQSGAVATEAAKAVPGSSAGEIQGSIIVAQSGATDIINITARNLDPVRARDIANALAKAYIENRRVNAVGGIQRVADQLQTQMVDLQNQIAVYDGRIGDGGILPGATAAIVAPTPAATTGPTAPEGVQPTAPALDPGTLGAPTTQEGLKAARYAAAVQYQSVYSRRQELLIDMSLKRGNAELLQEAAVPGASLPKGTTSNAILGALVGLMLGTGIALLREQLDDRLRATEDVERATGLLVIAETPDDPRSSKPTFVATRDDPLGGMAEATRTLRTSVNFLGIEDPVRSVVVTSASPGEGKSHIAANLAAAYAQSGAVTILVSADLRRPRLETMFGVDKSAVGLTDLIAASPQGSRPAGLLTSAVGGRHAAPQNGNGNGNPAPPTDGASPDLVDVPGYLRNALRPTAQPNLYLLPAGAIPPNPAELIGSRRARELFDELAQSADIVIIDTPPLLAVTDPVVVASSADAVLVVAALGETRRGASKRAIAKLGHSGSRILGVVLNKVEPRGTYGYEYGYSYRLEAARDVKRDNKRRNRRKARRADAQEARKAARDNKRRYRRKADAPSTRTPESEIDA